MRILSLSLAVATATGLAGCGATPGQPPRPAYYIAPPPPGERRCVEFGEDMYGRRYCARYYRS